VGKIGGSAGRGGQELGLQLSGRPRFAIAQQSQNGGRRNIRSQQISNPPAIRAAWRSVSLSALPVVNPQRITTAERSSMALSPPKARRAGLRAGQAAAVLRPSRIFSGLREDDLPKLVIDFAEVVGLVLPRNRSCAAMRAARMQRRWRVNARLDAAHWLVIAYGK